jgi:hypothetical protein
MPLSARAFCTPLDVLLEPSPGYGPAVSSGITAQVVLSVATVLTLAADDAADEEDDELEDVEEDEDDAVDVGIDVPLPPPPQLPRKAPAPSPPIAYSASRRVTICDFCGSVIFSIATPDFDMTNPFSRWAHCESLGASAVKGR